MKMKSIPCMYYNRARSRFSQIVSMNRRYGFGIRLWKCLEYAIFLKKFDILFRIHMRFGFCLIGPRDAGDILVFRPPPWVTKMSPRIVITIKNIASSVKAKGNQMFLMGKSGLPKGCL